MASKKNNIWEDKLNQLQPPDGDGAWQHMELLLDKHKPVNPKRFPKYILLVALLLLLVIGVCNCPFIGTDQNGLITKSEKQSDNTPDKTQSVDVYGTGKTGLKIQQPQNKNEGEPVVKKHNKFSKSILNSKAFNRHGNEVMPRMRDIISKGKLPSKDLSIDGKNSNNTSITETDNILKDDQELNVSKEVQPSFSDSALGFLTGIKDSSFLSSKSDTVTIDTPLSNQASQKSIGSKSKKPSLSFGVGVNHFISINSQKTSSINADGGFRGWKNYIPVVYFKYNISNKLYLSGEININSPQYTDRGLLNRKVSFSSSPGPPITRNRLEENNYTKKFFYTNVPLIVNVSPAKNVFVGSGVQYSRLSNAIIISESKISINGRPDSLISLQNKAISNNFESLNLKGHEWRFIANATLKINRFDIGTRYTRSFTSYTRTNNTPPINKGYNSSLSFFVRYDLFTVTLK